VKSEVLRDVDAVVVTGVYGSGKSSVVEEVADVLEQRGSAYAAMDLDWLWWFDAGQLTRDERRQVLMSNLSAVVDNYTAVGVERFLMAWAIESGADLNALRATMPMPLRVVRLTVPLDVIRSRLSSTATTARLRDDLAIAERWTANGTGTDLGDLEISNNRPLRQVANDIVSWLGWL